MTGVSVLLGLSVYQSIINAKLPATSDCVPLLGKHEWRLFINYYHLHIENTPIIISWHNLTSATPIMRATDVVLVWGTRCIARKWQGFFSFRRKVWWICQGAHGTNSDTLTSRFSRLKYNFTLRPQSHTRWTVNHWVRTVQCGINRIRKYSESAQTVPTWSSCLILSLNLLWMGLWQTSALIRFL